MTVRRTLRAVLFVVTIGFLTLFSAAGCSTADPVQPGETSQSPAATAPPEVTPSAAPPSPTVVPEPTLDDEDLTEIVRLNAGEQVQDAQGNLIAIYGAASWPDTFSALPAESRPGFPFFGDVESLQDPAAQLVALDVGMCAAGIDSERFGTAEFFVHATSDEVLSTSNALGRGILARHPVLSPGFSFPAEAECTRGWLPVLWGSQDAPGVARYLLATRTSANDEVERHLYQWSIGEVAAEPEGDLFSAGQLVTFNAGLLQGTTIQVDGWAEFVGTPTGIEGTRMVGVLLNACPENGRWPEFGITLDGWALSAPLDSRDQLGFDRGAALGSCYDGWMQFAAPFGAVPTGFFVSDGRSPTNGYAEWSLEGAALPTPQ